MPKRKEGKREMNDEYRNDIPFDDEPEMEKEEPMTGAPEEEIREEEQPEEPKQEPKAQAKRPTGGNRQTKGGNDKDRVRSSTAGSQQTKGGTAKKVKKERVQLKEDHSGKPAHRVIPYVLLGLAAFLGVCLLFNLCCNFGNKLAENPAEHWMGSFGYWLCYALFGCFGPAVFVLPFLLVNLSAFWKKYIANRIAIPKILVSLAFLILLGSLIHIFNLTVLPKEEWAMAAGDLMLYGAEMTGGGLLGGGFGYFLVHYLNIPGALIITVCLLAASLFYFIGMTPQHLWTHLRMWHKLHREKRVTLSEQEAETAKHEAEMKQKIEKVTQSTDLVTRETDDEGLPVGAVRVVDGKKHHGKRDREELAPMPMPNIDRTPDDPFIPYEFSKMQAEEEAEKKAKEIEAANAAEKEAQKEAEKEPAIPVPKAAPEEKPAQPAPQPMRPAQPVSPVQPVPPAPRAETPESHVGDRTAHSNVDPIFPRSAESRNVKKVQKADRNFDLKNIFIDLDDKPEPSTERRHAPLPPEKPLPGTTISHPQPSPDGQATIGFAPRTGQPAPARPAQAPAPSATGTPAPAQKPGSIPGNNKPLFRPATAEPQDVGLSDEEFDRLEASNVKLPPRPGQTPAPAGSGAQKAGSIPGSIPGRAPATGSSAGSSAPATVLKAPAPKPAQAHAPAPKPEPPKPYVFPPISYLHPAEPMTEQNREEIAESMNQLSETLANFRVGIKEITYANGPTVTRYEVTPAPGVRVRSIVNLSDDIALSLRSSAGIRIEAPIPGKNAVGIEVPNLTRSTVYLRELLETPKFTNESSKLTAGLGADVTGNPLLFDISKMPHLLVAGTTGSGKSVCINCIIMSLLYKAKPEDVKLVLIDPKKVEFTVYKNIPHLMAPIVTTPKDAAGALQASVEEMERRFELFEQVGTRDLKGYNELTKDDPDMPHLPQVVIIIDELADLMMTAPDEVETAICRIAQKARAAGMHLIVGTQRPSVDVVTGLIKSNIPSRIAFTVASQVDSKTILDFAGAEKLAGKGDMLFAPIGSMKPSRVQGAFVGDQEVEKVCEFLRATNGTAQFDEKFISKLKELAAQCGNKGKGASSSGGGSDLSGAEGVDSKGGDTKYIDAIRVAIEEKRVSTSLLQRKLEVGYSRAAKLIDRMEEEGIVSKPDGAKPRNILITPEEFIERFVDGADAADGSDEQ